MFGLLVLSAVAGSAGLVVAAFGVYSYAFLGLSYLVSMPALRMRAQRMDLDAEGKQK